MMLKFELSEQALAIIGKALGAQPYDAVASVIAELQKQINEQQKSAAAPGGNGKITSSPLEVTAE
jgi:hypothetical protein